MSCASQKLTGIYLFTSAVFRKVITLSRIPPKIHDNRLNYALSGKFSSQWPIQTVAWSVLNVTLSSKRLANVPYLVIVFIHTRAWILDQSLSGVGGRALTISPYVPSAHL